MKKIIFIILSYLITFFNFNLSSEEGSNKLKVGLLVPLSGDHKDLGNSFLYSLQLALDEIDDKNIIIIPRDSGINNKKKLNRAIQEIRSEGVKVMIGPLNFDDFSEVKNYSDVTFISPSNISPSINNNIISVGISLESQLNALINFIKKQKKTKTVIMYPENKYTNLIEKKLRELNLSSYRKFKYSPNPEVLTGEIEILTNYAQRKKNLELRKKMFEDKDDEQSIKELERLEQLYTLGDVNFDSVIIIDFGNNLKSVLTSLVYTDVRQDRVLFTTVNQWFDQSIFYENTIKTLYYPSIDYKEFKKFNKKFFDKFSTFPSEISILAYDALGLIYYAWKKNKNISSINNFNFKNKIKGKIGTFSFKDKKVLQDLYIYKTEKNKFIRN